MEVCSQAGLKFGCRKLKEITVAESRMKFINATILSTKVFILSTLVNGCTFLQKLTKVFATTVVYL